MPKLNIALIGTALAMLGVLVIVVKFFSMEVENEKLKRDIVVKPIEDVAKVYHKDASLREKEIKEDARDYNFTIPDRVVWDDFFDGVYIP